MVVFLILTGFSTLCHHNHFIDCCWPSLPQRYTASSRSTHFPPGPPGLFMKSCFPTGQPLACSDVWGYSSVDAGLGTYLCWTSRDSCFTISSACREPSEWQHLLYQSLLPFFLVTCKLADWPPAQLCDADHKPLSSAAEPAFSVPPWPLM